MSAVKKVEEFEAVGFVPVKRPDIPPYPMSKPFDWRVDPYNDSNWCFQLQTLRYLMIYQAAYRETGNEEYFLSLIDWFGDWWSSAKSRPGSYTWHDMATGIRAEKIHQLAKEIKASGIKKPVWFDGMIQAHVRVLRKKGFIRLNHNHGLYAVHGLRCLAEHLGPGMKKNVLGYTYSCFEKIIKNQFDENYVHKEHSPHYHHLVLRSLKEYKKTGLYDSLTVLDEYIEGAEKVAPNLYLPDGREIPFGDTDNQEPLSAALSKTPANETVWCASGYAVYKKKDRYLCLTNSYNSSVHKHWDNLSIIYGDVGVDVLVDPGKYKYTNDKIRKSVISSVCHNTINFDEDGWGAGCVDPSSLSTTVSRGDTKIFFDAAMTVRKGCLNLSVSREVEVFKSGVLIKDRALEKQGVGQLTSSFVFDQAAKVISSSVDAVEMEIRGVRFKLDFLTDFEKNRAVYEVGLSPVSYSYGSYVNSLNIKVFFFENLTTKLVRLEED